SGIIFMRCEFLALRDVALHCVGTTTAQPMSKLEQIHRCAHERVRSFHRKTMKKIVATALCRRVLMRELRAPRHSGAATFHTFPWRLGQVVRRQLELLAQFAVKRLKSGRDVELELFACGGFWQISRAVNALAECNPNWCASQRQQASRGVVTI